MKDFIKFGQWYIYNIFTIKPKWQVIIGSNLGPLLTSLFKLPLIVNINIFTTKLRCQVDNGK